MNRCAILAAGLLLVTAAPAMLPGPGAAAIDRHDQPALLRTISSRSGAFSLILQSDANRSRATVTATLTHGQGGKAHPYWSHSLPHYDGPRFAYVSDRGSVVLVDEWRNSPSPMALTLIDPSGTVIARHGFDDIVALLGVPRAAIPSRAKLGLWMSAPPQFDASGRRIRFTAAGKRFDMILTDGALKLAPSQDGGQ